MYEDLQEAMTLLHIDMANLVRMMISEHVGEYIARGRKGANLVVRAREQPSEETREETSSLDVPVIGRRILDLGSDQDVASQASRVEERE